VVAIETISAKNNDLKGNVTTKGRYYLSNHQATDQKLQDYIRNHWGIGNKLHWVLDVHLKEDDD
jgi:predicted transposase YbfD/YdcC